MALLFSILCEAARGFTNLDNRREKALPASPVLSVLLFWSFNELYQVYNDIFDRDDLELLQFHYDIVGGNPRYINLPIQWSNKNPVL